MTHRKEGGVSTALTDISDRTTLSAEVRRQEDDNTSLSGDDTFNNVSESIQPRIAITHALNDNWSASAQYSTGTNPAGVNLPFTDQTLIDSLTAANAAGFITYDASTYFSFREEEVTNFEVGIKGGPSATRRRSVHDGLGRHRHGRFLRMERTVE